MATADVTLILAANGKVGTEGNACGSVLVNAGEEVDTDLLAKHGIKFDSKGKLTGYSTDPIPVTFPGLAEAKAQFDQVLNAGAEPADQNPEDKGAKK
jgi:hypothetical protein